MNIVFDSLYFVPLRESKQSKEKINFKRMKFLSVLNEVHNEPMKKSCY